MLKYWEMLIGKNLLQNKPVKHREYLRNIYSQSHYLYLWSKQPAQTTPLTCFYGLKTCLFCNCLCFSFKTSNNRIRKVKQFCLLLYVYSKGFFQNTKVLKTSLFNIHNGLNFSLNLKKQERKNAVDKLNLVCLHIL